MGHTISTGRLVKHWVAAFTRRQSAITQSFASFLQVCLCIIYVYLVSYVVKNQSEENDIILPNRIKRTRQLWDFELHLIIPIWPIWNRANLLVSELARCQMTFFYSKSHGTLISSITSSGLSLFVPLGYKSVLDCSTTFFLHFIA